MDYQYKDPLGQPLHSILALTLSDSMLQRSTYKPCPACHITPTDQCLDHPHPLLPQGGDDGRNVNDLIGLGLFEGVVKGDVSTGPADARTVDKQSYITELKYNKSYATALKKRT